MTFNYDWKINDDWDFGALIGNEIVNKTTKYIWAYGENFNFPGWNHIGNATVNDSSESISRRRTIGNFANLSLSWKNMLFLNATGRQDIVSSMPRGNRSFFYPSVSLGFIFTEIEALKNNVLTYGKLRASYAEVGQAGSFLPNYYSSSNHGSGFSSGTPIRYPLGSVVGYAPSSVPLASSTGYGSFMTNGGKIHTNAHEITLGIKPFDGRNFKWDLNFNFSKIDNYVDELADGVESIFLGGFTTPQVRAGIGDKYPVIYGSQYLRNENGDIVVDENGLPQAGADGVIGVVSPDFRLGLNTNIEYKKLRLSATFDWKQGGQMYGGTTNTIDYYGVTQRTADFRNKDQFLFEEKAVKQNADGTYSPNDIYIKGSDAYYYFDALNTVDEASVYDNSFIKLREITLSYPVFNKPWLSITASVFARNIILWSELKGIDPEVSQGNNNMSGSFERFSLPGTSSYGLGVTVKF